MIARNARPKQATGLRTGIRIAMLVAMVSPAAAFAATDLTPYGKLAYEHDSNIFAFPSAGPDLPPGAQTAQGDSREAYVAGADLMGLYGRQKLIAKLEGRRFNYDRFGDLSHNESLVSGELDYAIGGAIDGVVRSRQEKRMAPFTERVSNVLAIETERVSFANMRFMISPEWSIQPNAGRRDLDSPQQLYPDLRLREDTIGALLTYAGLGPLHVGLDGMHMAGTYSGVAGVPSLSQTLIQLTADYRVTGLSTFKGAIGHTQRKQGADANNISAVTGLLGYRRQVTGKTALNLEFSRAVNSYITAGGSEIDTRGYASAEWQATYKLGIVASYAYTQGKFVGDILPGAGVAGRRDRFGIARVDFDYKPLRWLEIRPYVQYRKRDSNDPTLSFTGTLVGIELTARRIGDQP